MERENAQEKYLADQRVTRELVAYFVLAFAITFGLGVLGIFFRPQFEAVVGPLGPLITSWPYYVAVCAPTISAVVVSALFGGPSAVTHLFSGLFRPARLGWVLAAFLTIPVAFIAWGLVERLGLSGHAYSVDIRAILISAPILWFTTPEVFVDPGPWGEETGWRGFALPRLLKKFPALWAAIILGAIWSLWHLPAFFLSGLSQSGLNFGLFFVAGICLTIFMTWIFVHANRNYLVAGVIPHAVSNHLFVSHAYLGIRVEALVFIAIAVFLVSGFGPSLKGWRSAQPAPARPRNAAAGNPIRPL